MVDCNPMGGGDSVHGGRFIGKGRPMLFGDCIGGGDPMGGVDPMRGGDPMEAVCFDGGEALSDGWLGEDVTPHP